MSAKTRNQEVLSYLKKVKCEFLARRHAIFWTKDF